jgi:hypothetical protein
VTTATKELSIEKGLSEVKEYVVNTLMHVAQ